MIPFILIVMLLAFARFSMAINTSSIKIINAFFKISNQIVYCAFFVFFQYKKKKEKIRKFAKRNKLNLCHAINLQSFVWCQLIMVPMVLVYQRYTNTKKSTPNILGEKRKHTKGAKKEHKKTTQKKDTQKSNNFKADCAYERTSSLQSEQN